MYWVKMDIIKKTKRLQFKNEGGILCSEIKDSTTIESTEFYIEAPFPNYQGYENAHILQKIVSENIFLNDLKKHIGLGKKFIEVGSGTCQLSLAFAVGTNNLLVAMDPTKESLKLGRDFAKKNNINNVTFLNSDIFDDVVQDNFFDVVWCSGVLHHTKDSKKGFEIISKWVKADGIIIIGVYNKIGRLRTIVRKYASKLFGKKFLEIFDPTLKNLKISDEERVSWIKDQYFHPIESLHTLDEVLEWFKKNDIQYINSIPSCDFEITQNYEDLFSTKSKGSFYSRIINQIFMIFNRLGSDGGLFIVIGKKNIKTNPE